MNRSLGLLARIAMLTVAFLATHTAFLHLVPAPVSTRALSDALAREAAASLPQVAFLTATTIAAVVMRSRWQGGRLFGALFALLFGLGTLVPLLEPLAFPAYGAGSDAEHLRHNLLL